MNPFIGGANVPILATGSNQDANQGFSIGPASKYVLDNQ